MATYSRGQNNSSSQLPATQAALPSKDLSSVVVTSLQTVIESLGRDEVPVSYKDVEKAVTQGINKSVIAKNGVGTGVGPGGKADLALAEKYEQEKYIKWQEYQKKLQKDEENERERLKQKEDQKYEDIKRKVDETFSKVTAGFENPLKGFSDFVDSTVKNFSTGFAAGFKSMFEKPEERNDELDTVLEKRVGTVTSEGFDTVTSQLDEMKELIEDGQKLNNEDLEKLIEDNEDNEKKVKQEKDKDEQDKKEDRKTGLAQVAATQGIGQAVGVVVGKVAAVILVAAAIIFAITQLAVFLKGQFYKLIADFPVKWAHAWAQIKAWAATIPDRLELVFTRLFSKVKIMGKPLIGALGDEEKEELKTLEKDKDIKEVNNKIEKLKKWGERSRNEIQFRDYVDDIGELTNEHISTPEGQKAYLQQMNDAFQAGIKKAMDAKEYDTAAALEENRKFYLNQARDKFTEINNMRTPEVMAKVRRLTELNDLNVGGIDQMLANKEAELNAKAKGVEAQTFEDEIYKRMEKGKLTQYQMNQAVEDYGLNKEAVMTRYKQEHNTGYNYAAESRAEHFVSHEYQDWKDSWSTLFKEFAQDVGVKVNVVPEKQNPARNK